MPDPQAADESRVTDDTETLPGPDSSPASRSGPVRPVFEPGRLAAGRFRISRLIRQGGMGQVYEAEDLELGHRVALKTLRPELAADDRLVARFKEEIGLSRRVTHPNACRAFDLFRHEVDAGEAVLFISMEYLPGQPLDRVLAEHGPLPVDRARAVAGQVAEGLEAAHRAGVLHRDLKPANVLLVPSRDGLRAVVTDFGLAEAAAESLPGDPWVGTPSRMAPEQLEGRGASACTDVWALGLLLFELRTGRLPDPGELGRPATRRRLGRRWAAAIRGCLAPDPETRFSSPREALDRLDGAPPGPQRWRRLVPWAAVLAAAAAMGAVLYTGVSPGPVADPEGDTGRSPSAAAVPARPAAAVLTFASDGPGEEWLREALPQMLQAHLATGDSVRLVPARYLAELGALSPEDPMALGRTLDVRWLVTGRYAVRESARGPLLEVDVRLLDAESGRSEDEFSDSQPVEQLFELVARIAARLRAKLEIEQLSPVELGLLEGSLPDDLGAFRLYSEGILALDDHRPDRARTLLERAVTAAPDYPPGRAALAEALYDLGYVDRAAQQAREAFRLAEGSLPRAEVLRIEARYREISQDWEGAIGVWRALRTVFPDRPEHGFGLAHAQFLADRPAASLETLEDLVETGMVSGEDPRVHLAEARAQSLLGDYPGALRAAATAETRAVEEELPALALAASLERAYVLRESGALDEAETLYRAALRILESWDDPGQVASVSHQLGVIASYRADYVEARRLYEEAVAVFRELGDADGAALVLTSLSLTLAELGDLRAADRRAAEAVEIQRRLGNDRNLAAALDNQGGIAWERGELERAETLYTEAARLVRDTGSRDGLAATLNNLCAIHLDRGDTRAARRAVAEALEISREMESDFGVAITLITLAAVDHDELELDAARRRLEESRRLAAEEGMGWLLGHADEGLGRVALEAGDLEGARARLESALARRQETGGGLEIPTSQCALADLALAEGNLSEAVGLARSCLSGSRRSGRAPQVPQAGALLAEALIRLGRLEEAERVAAAEVFPGEDSSILAVRVAAVRVRALLAAAHGERERAIRELRALLETGDLARGPPRLQRRSRRLLQELPGPAWESLQ